MRGSFNADRERELDLLPLDLIDSADLECRSGAPPKSFGSNNSLLREEVLWLATGRVNCNWLMLALAVPGRGPRLCLPSSLEPVNSRHFASMISTKLCAAAGIELVEIFDRLERCLL